MNPSAAPRHPFAARYYDGKTSRAHNVSLSSDGARLLIRGDEIKADIALTDVRVSSRPGESPRYLLFPDWSKGETGEHEAV